MRPPDAEFDVQEVIDSRREVGILLDSTGLIVTGRGGDTPREVIADLMAANLEVYGVPAYDTCRLAREPKRNGTT